MLLGPMGPAGFRRRGRRRGLVVGAAVGAGVARAHANRQQQNDASQQQESDTQQPVSDSNGQYDELERLADLKNRGLITEEEYAAKKKQILGL